MLYLDYITEDVSFADEISGTLYTLLYKAEVTVELTNAGTTGEYYDALLFAVENSLIAVNKKLLNFSGANSGGDNSMFAYTQILQAGALVKMNRGSQFGQTNMRLHIKRLPEAQ